MTLTEFVSKWNGKFIDFDGVYGNQCMDLMHQYCVEVLGITDGRVLAAPCAKDVYNNFENIFGHELFDKIPNTPDGVPQEGDIMFWGTGTWGHVASPFIEGDTSRFRSFDQNYPTNSPCHVQEHSYSGVLGWLRCKGNGLQDALDKCVSDRNSHWNDLIVISDKLHVAVSRTVILAEIEKLISYEDAVVQKDRQLTEAQAQIVALQKQTQERDIALAEMSKKAEELTNMVNIATSQNQELSMALQELKKQCATPSFVGWKKTIYEWLLKVR